MASAATSWMTHGMHHHDGLTIATEGIVAVTRWTEAANIHRILVMLRWIVTAELFDATGGRPPGLPRGPSAGNNNFSTALRNSVAAVAAIVISANAGIASVTADLTAAAFQPPPAGIENELRGDLEDFLGTGSAHWKRNTDDTGKNCQ